MRRCHLTKGISGSSHDVDHNPTREGNEFVHPYIALKRGVRPALLLGLLVAGVFVLTPGRARAGAADTGPAPDPNVAAIERDFLMGMIPHHRGAIMMAGMVLEKSNKPELRDMAQQIIDSQQREIIIMSQYLRDWYGMEPPAGDMMPDHMMDGMQMPMMRGFMPDMMARMEQLRSLTGDQFEIAFLNAMIDHHAMAIMMTAPVLITAYHGELYGLGADIVKAQGKEIEMMQRWLAAWYGVEHPFSAEMGGGHHEMMNP